MNNEIELEVYIYLVDPKNADNENGYYITGCIASVPSWLLVKEQVLTIEAVKKDEAAKMAAKMAVRALRQELEKRREEFEKKAKEINDQIAQFLALEN